MKLGDVIMTRELERDGETVLVEIGRPMPFPPGGSDYYVPFRIDYGEVLMAGGIDSVQAMLFALAMIGDMLKAESRVTFLGGEPGFPISTPEEGTYVATLRVPMDMRLLGGST